MDTPEPDRHKAEAVSYQHLRCLPTTSMRRAGGVSAESEEDNDDEDGDSELEELLERLLL